VTTFGPPNQSPGPQIRMLNLHRPWRTERTYVYIAWHEFPTAASTQPDVFFSRNTNKGGSFSSRVNIGNSDPIDSRDEDIAVSRSNVFVAWSENVNDILFREARTMAPVLIGRRSWTLPSGLFIRR
jgi:hypothetical protein